MRVAFLSVSSEMGGSEVSLLEAVRGLRRAAPDWHVEVIVPRPGPLSEAAAAAGAGVRTLPLPDGLARLGETAVQGRRGLFTAGRSLVRAAAGAAAYSRRLARVLDDVRPEIVHSNGFKMHVLAARALPPRAALVWHIHEYVSPRAITRRLLQQHVARCSALIANSRSVADDVTRVLGTAVPVTTVYNAVDPDEFSPEGDALDLDALAGLPPAAQGTLKIGLLATYARWKGHATFVEALTSLAAVPPWRAYIVGGPLYDTHGSQYTRGDLERMIAARGLQDRVGLTGFVRRPAAALRALDVAVHASTQPEPFGLAIAEGLATGRAVIASAAGGAAELVTDGCDALTHPPGDRAALAACLTRACGDPSLRARLGGEGRRTALRKFAPAEFTRKLIAVYEEARARAVSHGRP